MHPRELLNSLNANPRKSLSQNFLTSPHWAERLTDLATQKPCDEIWEIGPGLGALTRPLVEKAGKKSIPVKLFEYDKIFVEYLKKEIPQADMNAGDVLEADFQNLIGTKHVTILSNLPYNISSPILRKFVAIKPSLVRLILTFQKEFADRLLAEPRTSAYGALTVTTQLHFSVEPVGTIPPKAFYPAPEIASEALCLEPKENAPGIEPVDGIVHAAFLHRRKKAIGNLKKAYPEKNWEEIYRKLGLPEGARAEEFDKDAYLALGLAYSQA